MPPEFDEQPLPDLGELEYGILHLVWQRGPVSAEQCREALDRPLKESTVRTVLRRLEEKGFVRHRVEGRTFLYEAVERPNRVAVRAVQAIVDRFCGGSFEQLLTGLVDGEVVAGKELERLAKKIAQANAKGTKR